MPAQSRRAFAFRRLTFFPFNIANAPLKLDPEPSTR